jgi:hypothetical protein
VYTKAAFKKKGTLFNSKLELNLRGKPLKCYIWSTALCGVETWALRRVGRKYQGSFDMWCRRRMEKISWTDRVRNAEEERNILHTTKRRKAKYTGHTLRGNCLLKHVVEGKLEGRIETKGRQGRRGKQLLDDLKEHGSY